MMKATTLGLVIAAALAPGLALADLTNGDFETGDLTGWSTDTDGLGPPSPLSPDFQVVAAPPISGAWSARVEGDYWSIPGDIGSTPQDQVIGANTLFQALDTTTVGPNDVLILSFDWAFAGENSPPDEVANFGIYDGSDFYLADGTLGFMVQATSYGSGTFSAVLDPSFYNAGGFEFAAQLVAGFDGYGSYLLVDNVKLTRVPEPATALAFGPGLALLGALRLRARRRETETTSNAR